LWGGKGKTGKGKEGRVGGRERKGEGAVEAGVPQTKIYHYTTV